MIHFRRYRKVALLSQQQKQQNVQYYRGVELDLRNVLNSQIKCVHKL